MATTKQATYKQFNGTDWDTIYFKTSAGQVGESSTLYFLRPATHKVNGKSFYGTTHQGITLYGTDIMVNTDSTQTITQAISNIEQTLDNMDFASSDHDHDSVYFKLSNILSSTNTSLGSFDDFDTAYAGNNNVVLSAGALINLLGDFATWGHGHTVASTTQNGFMSKDDKANLDALTSILGEDTDNVVNKINEVFDLFKDMGETTTLISLLNRKFNSENVLGTQTFHDPNEKDDGYGSYVLAMEYVQDDDHVVSAGALYEILRGFAGSEYVDNTYLKKSGGEISGDLQVHQRILTPYVEAGEANISYLEMWDETETYLMVVLNPYTATYTIEGKKISTTNIYYGAVDPTQDNNANNVQAGDIWLEYANGVG